MGGNLYKVSRVSKDEYESIVSSLLPILNTHFGEYYKIPVAYKSKRDYGDVDIILNATYLQNKNWEESLIKDLGDVKVKKVRNVTSVLYKDFQVDFFCVGESRFESTYNFMCYNILGNLFGRIFHKFNLKYGEDGLKYVLRGFNNHVSKEIILTRDLKKSLEFLELDYKKWQQGFDRLEDIFEYVINCKYFCSNSYNEDYFNVRKRAVERPDFNKFLDYIKDNKIDKNYPFEREKKKYIPMIEKYFPESNLFEKYETHLDYQQRLSDISEKFNGKRIIDLLGIKGAELGKYIGSFKEKHGDQFEYIILNSIQPEIDERIINHYNDFKQIIL